MLTPRSTFPLVLLAACLAMLHVDPPALQAQPGGRSQAPGGLKQLALEFDPSAGPLERIIPSYQPLQDDPREFRPGAEWEVQGRLQAMQQLQEMQKNARQLARDPELLNRLHALRPDEVEKLRQRLQSPDQISASPQMQELFKKLATGRSNQDLPRESVDALRKFIDEPDRPVPPEGPPPTPDNGSPPVQPALSPPANPDVPPTPPDEPSRWDRFQGEAADWVRDNLRDAGGDLADVVDRWQGGQQGQALRDLFSGKDAAEGGLRYRLAEQAQGLSGHLPHLDLHVPQMTNALEPFRSLWVNVEPPHLGGFSSSVPRGGAASQAMGDWTFALLFGLLGVLLLFLMGRQMQLRRGSDDADGEVLGPWPVAPETVSTREQLVRAFDYLALRSLGMQARSCHHLDVAAQLGRRGGDSAHEQAAESLARLYEQARYAPDTEPLGPAELAAARRHLSFLAGATAS